MASSSLRLLISATVGATAFGLLSNVTPTQAAVLNFAFEVDIAEGSNRGTHRGTFSFDSSEMIDCETPSTQRPQLKCANPSIGNLSILFDLMGETYTEQDDIDYQRDQFQYPVVYFDPELDLDSEDFEDNVYLSFIFNLKSAPQPTQFAILGIHSFTGSPTIPTEPWRHEPDGYVTYFRQSDSTSDCQTAPELCEGAAVPEPSEIAGSVFAVGLMGMFWRSRRKRSRFNPVTHKSHSIRGIDQP